jgi:hypothetical protein
MSKNQKIFFISIFSLIGVVYVLMNLAYTIKSAELDRRAQLLKEIDSYNACNGNRACENLNPEAKSAIDSANKRVEEKSLN